MVITMKRIITIQHTQSEQHINGMIGSWGDWDLTETGIKQANNIGLSLRKKTTGEKYVLYSSDLKRTMHTAEIISDHLNLKPIYSELLREFNLGEAIGKTKEWAKKNTKCSLWPNLLDWAASKNGQVFEGAESRADVWRRVSEFFDKVVIPSEDNLIIVSHDGTLSIFFALWLGLNLDYLDHFNISGKTGGVSMLYEDSAGNHVISSLNDMSYVCENEFVE